MALHISSPKETVRNGAEDQIITSTRMEEIPPKNPKLGEETLPTYVKNKETIIQEERRIIQKRREKAHFDASGPVQEDLVGVALSGGGIRSASFNLGILQALYQCGFLRFVDYLSTVSGGGYIGAFLSSRVHQYQKNQLLYKKEQGRVEPGDPELVLSKNGKQSQTILRLLRGGQYLDRPLTFLNRYLVGLVLNNIALFSFLLAVCALIAWAWRGLDLIPVRWWLADRFREMDYFFGFNREILVHLSEDLFVAFLPAFLTFFLWVLIWTFSLSLRGKPKWGTVFKALILFLILALFLNERVQDLKGTHDTKQGPKLLWILGAVFLLWYSAWVIKKMWGKPKDLRAPKTAVLQSALTVITKGLLFSTVAFFLIGFAVTIGNGDISTGVTQPLVPSNWFLAVLGIAVLICLLPLIRPWRLIGSGQKPHNQVESYIFRLASTALLVGVPLVIVFFLARENVSGAANQSIDRVSRWKDLADRVKERKTTPAQAIWEEINNKEKYDIQFMDDVKSLNKKGKSLVTLGDLVGEEDNSPAVGILPDSRYPHIGKRRQLMLLALSQVLDNEDLPSNTLAQEGIKKFDQPAIQEWLDPKSTDFEKAPNLDFPKEEFKNLLGKYFYLKENKENAKEFQKEWGKKDWKRKLNQFLLALYFPGIIPLEKRVVERVVTIDDDQDARFTWFWKSLVVCLIAVLLVNLNVTSLHSFYREQLSETYIKQSSDENTLLALKRLVTNTENGAPYHLTAASLSLYPSVWKFLFDKEFPWPRKSQKSACISENEPSTDGFLFSPLYCGSETTGYRLTRTYEINGEAVKLADAMAISGAAVSPIRVGNTLIKAIMMILNIRLGQWIPHPANFRRKKQKVKEDKTPSSTRENWLRKLVHSVKACVDYLIDGPNILGLVCFSGIRKIENRSFCFVTDGGHYENLGLWPLLDRRCFLILVSDASQDGRHSFEDFLRLCRQSRLEFDIDLVELEKKNDEDVPFQIHALRLNPDAPGSDTPYLQSLADRFSQKHYVVARIKYPEKDLEGYLVYIKSSLTGDEENDLVGFCKENKEFPHDPTTNPVFNENQVESYRQLGYHIAKGFCREIRDSLVQPEEGENEGKQALRKTLLAMKPEERFWGFEKFEIKSIIQDWVRKQSYAARKGINFQRSRWGDWANGDQLVSEVQNLGQQLKELLKERQATSLKEPHWVIQQLQSFGNHLRIMLKESGQSHLETPSQEYQTEQPHKIEECLEEIVQKVVEGYEPKKPIEKIVEENRSFFCQKLDSLQLGILKKENLSKDMEGLYQLWQQLMDQLREWEKSQGNKSDVDVGSPPG